MPPAIPKHTSPYLPIYTTPLIGRNTESSHVLELLQQHQCITLLGESGTGKTRLALQISQAADELFPDGIAFIALAPVIDPCLVIPLIATTLDIRETAQKPLFEQLINELKHKRMLLVLDNVEQLLEIKHELVTLLTYCPDLSILITSQVPLNITFEHTYHLPPLSYPTDTDLEQINLAELTNYTAIALFIERMQQVQPQFRLTPTNAAEIIEICQLLHGMPIAIELVAAHSAIIPPDILVLLLRTHLHPHQKETSIRKKIIMPILNWCYSRLEPRQRWLLPLLSMMKGSQIKAAQDILAPLMPATFTQHHAASQLIREDMLVLKEKNILLEEALPHGYARYVMLDVVQEFGMQLFHSGNFHHQFMKHYTTYYLAFAEASYAHFKTKNQTDWMQQLTYEQHNLRAVWQYLFVHDHITVIRLTIALCPFWFFQSTLSNEGYRCIQQVSGFIPVDNLELAARFYHEAGRIAYGLHRYQQAEEYYSSALKLSEKLGDRFAMASAAGNLGLLALNMNRLQQARSHLLVSLELWRELNDPWNCANSLNTLGIVASRLHDDDEAHQHYTDSLAMWEQVEYPIGKAMALNNLGEIELRHGHYQEAQSLLESAFELFRAHGGERFLDNVYLNLSQSVHALGDNAAAYMYGREALRRKINQNDLDGMPEALESLAFVLESQGHWSLIVKLMSTSHSLREHHESPRHSREQDRFNSLLAKLDQQALQLAHQTYTLEQITQLVQQLPPALEQLS